MPKLPIRTLVAAVAAASTLLPGVGHAGPTKPLPVGCEQSQDTLANATYLSCLGSMPGPLGAAGQGPLQYRGVDYALIGTTTAGDGSGGGPFQAFLAGLTDGELTFDAPWTGTFIVGLKAGAQHSLYAFHSEGGLESIHFDTLGIGDGTGRAGSLALVALYGGRAQPVVASVQGPSSDAVAAVPEPGTPALLLAGLAVVGLLTRRRRR